MWYLKFELEFARKTKIPRALLLRGSTVVAEPYLFKISQKRQSLSQSEHTSIPATRCLGSIGHLFLCSLFFQPPFLRLVRGAAGPALIRLSLKKHPLVFSTAKMHLFWNTRGTRPFVSFMPQIIDYFDLKRLFYAHTSHMSRESF